MSVTAAAVAVGVGLTAWSCSGSDKKDEAPSGELAEAITKAQRLAKELGWNGLDMQLINALSTRETLRAFLGQPSLQGEGMKHQIVGWISQLDQSRLGTDGLTTAQEKLLVFYVIDEIDKM